MQHAPETAARILKALKYRSRGMTIADIATATGINRNTAARQLELLRVNGQVELKEFGSAKVYYRAQRVPLSAFLCFTKNLVLVLDSAHRIVQVNDRCLKLAKRTKEDLVGYTLAAANLPVVSTPEALSIIESLEKEQIITDLRYQEGGKDLFFQLQVIPTTFEDGEKGATLVLEDITERKRYVQNMEFLAKTAMELVDMPPEQDIYQYIADRISELVPKTLIQVISYDEGSRQFTIQAIRDAHIRSALTRILGRDPVGLVVPMTEILSHPRGGNPLSLLQGQAWKFTFWPEIGPEGMSFYELSFRQIPPELCDEICRTLPIGKAYFIFLVWGERLFGNVGIILPPDRELEDTQVVESFLRQASIAIARRQTEDRLHRSERRLQEVLDASPIPTALVQADGRCTLLNRAFTERFGYTLSDIPTGTEWFECAFPDPGYQEGAIAAWKANLADPGAVRSRTLLVRCKDGAEKTVRFSSISLSDGTRYVACEDAAPDH